MPFVGDRRCAVTAPATSTITPSCGPGLACYVCLSLAPACQGLAACPARADGLCAPGCPGSPVDPNVLGVSIADSPAGPVCVTRCLISTREGRFPRITADAAARLAGEHRAHVREAGR